MPEQYVAIGSHGERYVLPHVAQLIDEGFRAGKPRAQLKHFHEPADTGKDKLVTKGEKIIDAKSELQFGEVYTGYRPSGKNTTFLVLKRGEEDYVAVDAETCGNQGLQNDSTGVKMHSYSIAVVYQAFGCTAATFNFDDPKHRRRMKNAKTRIINNLPEAVREQLYRINVVTVVTFPKKGDDSGNAIKYILFNHHQRKTYKWTDNHARTKWGIMARPDATQVANSTMPLDVAELQMDNVAMYGERLEHVVENLLDRDALWSEDAWREGERLTNLYRPPGRSIASKQDKSFRDAASMIFSTTGSGFDDRGVERIQDASSSWLDYGDASTAVASSLFSDVTTVTESTGSAVPPDKPAINTAAQDALKHLKDEDLNARAPSTKHNHDLTGDSAVSKRKRDDEDAPEQPRQSTKRKRLAGFEYPSSYRSDDEGQLEHHTKKKRGNPASRTNTKNKSRQSRIYNKHAGDKRDKLDRRHC